MQNTPRKNTHPEGRNDHHMLENPKDEYCSGEFALGALSPWRGGVLQGGQHKTIEFMTI